VGRDGSTGSMTFDCQWNNIESWEGTKIVVFRSGTMHLLLFKIYKRGLSMQGEWHSLNTLLTMVNGQTFHIMKWQPPICHQGTHWAVLEKKRFEDTKGVFRSCKWKDRQYHSQKKKDKQRSIKHYTQNSK
jgi:hypothetical protein